MRKSEVLELLQELVCSAVIIRSAPDDPSGLNTAYLVDQEQLLKNIETELEKLRAPANAGGCWYCSYKDGTMLFSTEFDTNVHEACLREAAEKPDHETAIMFRELCK